MNTTKKDGIPIKIVMIHDGSGPLRGSEGVALDLMKGLRERGCSWTVLTNHEAFSAACRADGFETEFGEFPEIGTTKDILSLIRGFRRAASLLRTIILTHQPDLIHINNGGSCHWACWVAWRHSLPTLVHLHAPWSRRMRFIRGLYLPDRIVGVSHAILKGFEIIPSVRKKLCTIYNGIDGNTVTPKTESTASCSEQKQRDRFVFAFVGVLIPEKRTSDAIEAIRLMAPAIRSKVALRIIGDGPERANLEKQSAGLPVEFLGQRKDVLEILSNECDALVLPSSIEAFSIVLLEAAVCGIPRIASDAGGNTESIHHGTDGLLHPLGNCASLSAAMQQLMESPQLVMTLRKAAKERISKEFTRTSFLTHFAELYVTMTAKRPKAFLIRLYKAATETYGVIARKS